MKSTCYCFVKGLDGIMSSFLQSPACYLLPILIIMERCMFACDAYILSVEQICLKSTALIVSESVPKQYAIPLQIHFWSLITTRRHFFRISISPLTVKLDSSLSKGQKISLPPLWVLMRQRFAHGISPKRMSFTVGNARPVSSKSHTPVQHTGSKT